MKVKVDGKKKTYPLDFLLVGEQIEFVATPSKGQVIHIYRETSTDPLIGWEDASVLRAKDLSIQETQLRHLYEEGSDLADLTNETAEEAKKIAEGIESKVDNAVATGKKALDIANGAKDTAEGIESKADHAVTTGKKALDIASGANDTAKGIDGKATQALKESKDAVTRVGALEVKITSLELGDAETLKGSTKEEIARTWRPSLTVALGQVIYPTDPRTPLALECIQAGTTGTIEPKGVEMQLVSDGTVKWGIFDVRSGREKVNGAIIFRNSSVVGLGYKVQNGTTLTNLTTKYIPLFQALVKGDVPYVSTAYWLSQSNRLNNGVGGVPYLGWDGGDTCMLPDVRDMTIKATGTNSNGVYHGDAIRNITASWSDTDTFYGSKWEEQGAMSITAGGTSDWTMMVKWNREYPKYTFDASRVVPTAPENRVKAIMQVPLLFIGYEVV